MCFLQRCLAFIWNQLIAQPAAHTFTFCLYVYSTQKQVWSIAKQAILNKEQFTIRLKPPLHYKL